MSNSGITCDACGKDLAITGNAIDYRIVVDNQRIMSAGEVVTLMDRSPHLVGPLHFCNTQCLKKWVDNNLGERNGRS